MLPWLLTATAWLVGTFLAFFVLSVVAAAVLLRRKSGELELSIQWTSTTLQNRKHRVAVYSRSGSETNKGKSVLLVHGYGKNRDILLPRAALIDDLGASIVLMEARQHGDSSNLPLLTSKTVKDDIETVMTWMKENGSNDIVVWGHSLGSCAALATAADGKMAVSGVIAEGAYPRLWNVRRRWFGRRGLPWPIPAMVTLGDWMRRAHWKWANPIRFVNKVGAPVLLAHTTNDMYVTYSEAEMLADAFNETDDEMGNRNPARFVTERQDHNTIYQDEAFRIPVRQFVAECLKLM